MPKVSVIIPVYNTEKYIRKCLDSVCNQTLSDIEIICINDCSTDNSLEILKEYAKNDARIKITDFKENKGAAIARNTGIEEANGEYIGFVDSDDFIDIDFYEKLYNRAVEDNADIAKGSYKYLKNGYIEKKINQKILNDKHCFVCEYCSAIFKNKFIKNYNIKFPELSDMEDPVFAFTCAINANKISVADTYINITTRDDSQTSKTPSYERINDKIQGLNLIISLANNTNISEDTYGYICGIWFAALFNNTSHIDLNSRLHLCNSAVNLYNKIKYKENFLENIEIYASTLKTILKEENFDDLFFYDKLVRINQDESKIKELTNSYSIMNKIINRQNEKLAKKLINENNKETIYLISVVNNYDLYDFCIKSNSYIMNSKNIILVDYDNTKENITISKRYNSFLKSYDFNNEAWFVFCHCDWEPLDDISNKLQKLDKNNIYGTIGAKAVEIKGKYLKILTGFCYEKRRDGSGFRIMGDTNDDCVLSDSFDCQCLIVHSSLVKKYSLLFDEHLSWDLYAEDFSISALNKHNIKSYAINLPACHWSGYHDITPQSYYDSLEYINEKFPNNVYAGTVSYIGGCDFIQGSYKEAILYKLRKNFNRNRENERKVINTI